jgi:hypothetical protein
VRFQLSVELDGPLERRKALVQRDFASGKIDDPRQRVEDLVGVDELGLDAFGSGGDRRVDQRPGSSKVSLVRGAQLRDDQAGLAPADFPVAECDHVPLIVVRRGP